MIIATVTKQRFSILQDLHLTVPFLLSLALLPINHYFSANDQQEEARYMREMTILILSFLGNLSVYMLYISNVIRQITQYLNIYCFSITKKRGDEAQKKVK